MAVYPTMINVSRGDAVQFFCTTILEGVVNWRRNGDIEIQFGGRVTQSATGMITINNVTYADIGLYTCVVMYNTTHTVEASANLTIRGEFYV